MTRRTYTDVQRLPTAHDDDLEATHAHGGVRHHDLGVRHLVPGWGQNGAHERTMPDGRRQPGAGTPTTAEHEHVDSPNTGAPHAAQEPAGVGVAGHDENDGPVGPPELRPGGKRATSVVLGLRRAGERSQGHEDHGEQRQVPYRRDNTLTTVCPGDDQGHCCRKRSEKERRSGTDLRERQVGGNPRHAGDPRQQ